MLEIGDRPEPLIGHEHTLPLRVKVISHRRYDDKSGRVAFVQPGNQDVTFQSCREEKDSVFLALEASSRGALKKAVEMTVGDVGGTGNHLSCELTAVLS